MGYEIRCFILINYCARSLPFLFMIGLEIFDIRIEGMCNCVQESGVGLYFMDLKFAGESLTTFVVEVYDWF